MAGYSGTSLERKLGLAPGQVLFLDGAPDDLVLETTGLRVVRRLPASVDVTLTFHTTLAGLEQRLPRLFERTSTAGMVWVCWPKKRSPLFRDLTEDGVREQAFPLDLVDVKVCAVDEDWSGLALVFRKERRAAVAAGR